MNLQGVRGESLGGHKSEVMYHQWHIFKVSLMVKGFVKTIHNFRVEGEGPLD